MQAGALYALHLTAKQKDKTSIICKDGIKCVALCITPRSTAHNCLFIKCPICGRDMWPELLVRTPCGGITPLCLSPPPHAFSQVLQAADNYSIKKLQEAGEDQATVSFGQHTISRCIKEMSDDIKQQTAALIKASAPCALRMD